MSQMSQAEAFKYFIERFRTAKWNKTGIIWWNVLDGWQQVSDAVVNYNFRPKLAYSFIRRAQEPVLMAFSDPQQDGRYDLHAVNDTQTAVVLTYEVRDLWGAASQDAAPLLLSGTVTVPADGNTVAARLDLTGGWIMCSISAGPMRTATPIPRTTLPSRSTWSTARMQTPCACAGLTALRGSDHIYAELSEIAHCCQFGRRYSEGDKNSFWVFIPLFDLGKPA